MDIIIIVLLFVCHIIAICFVSFFFFLNDAPPPESSPFPPPAPLPIKWPPPPHPPGKNRRGGSPRHDQGEPDTIRLCPSCRRARPLHAGTAQDQQGGVQPQQSRYREWTPVPVRVLHTHPVGGDEQPEQ